MNIAEQMNKIAKDVWESRYAVPQDKFVDEVYKILLQSIEHAAKDGQTEYTSNVYGHIYKVGLRSAREYKIIAMKVTTCLRDVGFHVGELTDDMIVIRWK